MALNGDTLGDLMADAVLAATTPAPEAADETELRDLMKALGAAIVSHFTSSAVVNVTSVSAVTPGAGVSGPGAGTLS